jgi:hypothetical protein
VLSELSAASASLIASGFSSKASDVDEGDVAPQGKGPAGRAAFRIWR